MYYYLTGKIIEKTAASLVLDVQGVGYYLQIPVSTFSGLPQLGESVRVLTHFVVREDAQLLFGFISERERKLFRALIKVNGVGPKLAMTILSGITADQFVKCVQEQDCETLIRIPGIGKKTAERLMIETRDRLSEWEATTLPVDLNQAMQDALSALSALGYKPSDAKKAISKIHKPDHNSEQLIKLALQQMIK